MGRWTGAARRLRPFGLAGALAGLLLAAGSALAEPFPAGTDGVRPVDRRLDPAPIRDPTESPPSLALPPPPEISPGERERLSAGGEGFVSRFVVEGSRVFSAAELAAAVAPFEGRMLRSEELFQARDAVTKLYHDAGYITSGALLPDQEVEEGIVVLQVVEGQLTDIEVRGTSSFSPRYFRDRLAWAGRAPVNVWRLEQALQRIQQSPLVDKIAARLIPAEARGESRLVLVVDEELPVRLSLATSNYRSTSIGEYTGEITGAWSNVLGFADELSVGFEGAEGLEDYEVAYAIPFTRFDTTLSLRFRESRGEVVINTFDGLGIESESRGGSVTLEQPLWRDYASDLRVGLTGEIRESETEVGVDPEFCTIAGDPSDCHNQVTVLRLYQQYTRSMRNSAIAMRSSFSLGIDLFGATNNRGRVADGQFFAWLGQLQGVYRLPDALGRTEVVARVDTQLANDPLLSIEKFSVGGARTVRGYRENSLVRDSGVAASVEFRVPVLDDPGLPVELALVPFGDFGYAWDEDGPADLGSDLLASLGIGLRASLYETLHAEVFWGGRLAGAPGDDPGGLQRNGVHFRIVLDAVAPWR